MVMLLERPTDTKTGSEQIRYPVGWFSTGRDPAARNLLTAVYLRRDELGIEIPFVFCNYKPGEDSDHKDYGERQKFFDLVNGYGIPLIALPWKPFKEKYGKAWRDEYGKAMKIELQGLPNNLDVAAGFMLWVPDNICGLRKILNLHPAKPGGPKGTWQEVIYKLISLGEKITGAQTHRVTPEWDEGPPVTYVTFPIVSGEFDGYWTEKERRLIGQDWQKVRNELGENNSLFKKIREEGERREIPLIVYTVGEFASGNVRFEGDSVVSRHDGIVENGYDITELIEHKLDWNRY